MHKWHICTQWHRQTLALIYYITALHHFKPGSKLNQNNSYCVPDILTEQSLKHDGESAP